jgi:hypothetical protein
VDPWGLECSASDTQNVQANTKKTNIYTNSSTFTTVIPIDGPATKSPTVIGLFSVTVTTNAVITPGSSTVRVSSLSTLGPTYYNAKASTTAIVTLNGFKYDTAILTPRPSILPATHVSLGEATLSIPLSGEIVVSTVTTWIIQSETGTWSPGTQTVVVPIE